MTFDPGKGYSPELASAIISLATYSKNLKAGVANAGEVDFGFQRLPRDRVLANKLRGKGWANPVCELQWLPNTTEEFYIFKNRDGVADLGLAGARAEDRKMDDAVSALFSPNASRSEPAELLGKESENKSLRTARARLKQALGKRHCFILLGIESQGYILYDQRQLGKLYLDVPHRTLI
jgi:hypothetical protein